MTEQMNGPPKKTAHFLKSDRKAKHLGTLFRVQRHAWIKLRGAHAGKQTRQQANKSEQQHGGREDCGVKRSGLKQEL